MIQLYRLHFKHDSGGFSLDLPLLDIARGETIAIIGPSGSGKTTLLNLLAGILHPDQGSIIIDDMTLSDLDDAAARNYRANKIGLIFQEFELLEYLNVLDNILLPYRINKELKLSSEAHHRATALAERTGISDKLERFPDQLSQGERQRVAVCRALITQPQLLLADEPTGNLDPDNKSKVLGLLLDMAREQNTTLVTVTHDHELVSRFDRVIDFAELTSSEADA
ncbi:MAG: ABC transporter ATP-binding protein [Gammaproteobacteria bacterium]|nr:ABC transporter ATP-binding protein [Gammaproteobacteria bacterium]